MAKFTLKLCVFISALIVSSSVWGQTDSASRKQSYLKAGINFINNNVYLGRTDSVSTPSITPMVSYTFSSGLYFSGALEYFTNRVKNKLDGGNIEAGYNFDVNDDMEGGVSFTKYFYNSNSTQVSSLISSEFNAYLAYDIAGIVTPSVSVNYTISKSGTKNDFLFNPSLSHDFAISKLFGQHDELLISPEAGINAGTQNFYDGYIARKKGNKSYQKYLAEFKTLDYELTMPIVYKTGQLRLSFTPTYASPQNGLPAAQNIYQAAILKAVPPLKNEFYFSLGMALKF